MLLLLREYASTYIHSFPSPEPPKNFLLLIWERIAKNIPVFPVKQMLKLSWLLPLAILFQEKSALKKEEKKIRGNKKGQVPGTSKEKKK